MKPIFGKHYKGIYTWETRNDLPVLKNNDVALLNKNIHWTAIYKKNGKLYEIDSFNRDLLKDQYIDNKLPGGFKQNNNEANCGQKTIALLIYKFFYKK
jgi:hypothetical protein